MENYTIFFGRLHPLFVHLPIGIICIAFLLDIFQTVKKSENPTLKRITSLAYGFTLISALIAILTGLMLADEARFIPRDITNHKWIGIISTILLGFLILIRTIPNNLPGKWQIVHASIVFFGISLAGHFGGILTHGKNHLTEFAPGPLKYVLGGDTTLLIDPPEIPDSVSVYRDFILPQLNSKCLACHNEKVNYGDFKFLNHASLYSKTNSGFGIIPGNSQHSEIFKRLILPPNDEKFMPPTGENFGYYDVKIMKYWIDQGADSLSTFEWDKMDDELKRYFLENHNLNFAPLPYFEKNTPDSINSTLIKELDRIDITAKYLGENNYYLEVKINTDSLTAKHFQELDRVGNNVTFLDLSNTKLDKELIPLIANFANLTKLDLHGNQLADTSTISIAELDHLISINVYDSKITKKGVENLLNMPSLQRIYLWKTKVSEAEITNLKANFPDKEIVTGFTFEHVPNNDQKEESKTET